MRAIKHATRLKLVPDVESILKDFYAAKLPLSYARGGGVIHSRVQSIFLRGNPKVVRMQEATVDEFFEPGESNNPELSLFPSVQNLLKQIPGHIGRVALLLLDGQSVIPVHRDVGIYIDQTYRVHIPLITNDQVLFLNNFYLYQMKVGEMWAINNHAVHGVMNKSDQQRLHLLFDMVVSEETTEFIRQGETGLGVECPDPDAVFPPRQASNSYQIAQ